MVPEGFVLPRPPLKTFFMLWHHGNIDTSIRHLKHLCKFDVTPADWVQVSRARGVIGEIERIAYFELALIEANANFSRIDRSTASSIFDQAFGKMIESLYGPGHKCLREGDRAIATLYRMLLKKRDK